MTYLNELSATDAVDALTTKRISATELCMACLDQIERADGEIEAFVHVDRDHVLKQAADIDAAEMLQPLAGLPIAVKDNFDTRDMPTCHGSAVYKVHRPEMDAAVIAALKRQGAIILGKTALTEFAGWVPTTTRNPRNLEHTPGGSSSGSCAAIAANMAPLALGTQTLGSVIRPASFCGIVGFKPSYGIISRVGVKSLAESLDTVGFFGRKVADVELPYRVLTQAATSPAPSGRLAFCRGPYWDTVEAEAQESLEAFVDELRSAGHTIDDLVLPAEFGKLCDAARGIHDYEFSHAFVPEEMVSLQNLSPSFVERMHNARSIGSEDYWAMLSLGDLCRRMFADVAAGYNAILCPSSPGSAPKGLGFTGDAVQNSFWTLLHLPCITLPVLTGLHGLPFGLQLVGHQFQDGKLLRVAEDIERFIG